MTREAPGGAVEQFVSARRIAEGIRRRFLFHAVDVGYDLPNLFGRHANTLAACTVLGHGGTGNSFVDGSKQVGIRFSMTFLRAGQIWTAPTSTCAQAVAKCAIGSKLGFASFCGFCIAGVGVGFLRERSNRCNQKKQKREGKSGEQVPGFTK
jgi:hypothetical protein